MPSKRSPVVRKSGGGIGWGRKANGKTESQQTSSPPGVHGRDRPQVAAMAWQLSLNVVELAVLCGGVFCVAREMYEDYEDEMK